MGAQEYLHGFEHVLQAASSVQGKVCLLGRVCQGPEQGHDPA